MAEENVDLRLIGEQMHRLQTDLRLLRTHQTKLGSDQAQVHGQVAGLDAKVDAMAAKLSEVDTKVDTVAADLDAFRESASGQFEQVVRLVREVYASLKAEIKALRQPG